MVNKIYASCTRHALACRLSELCHDSDPKKLQAEIAKESNKQRVARKPTSSEENVRAYQDERDPLSEDRRQRSNP